MQMKDPLRTQKRRNDVKRPLRCMPQGLWWPNRLSFCHVHEEKSFYRPLKGRDLTFRSQEPMYLKCMVLLRMASRHVSIPPKSEWHNGQSRLMNQSFISTECVRSILLLTGKCQVVSVDCTACGSYPFASSLIGRTRN